jgi:hypothetical protein
MSVDPQSRVVQSRPAARSRRSDIHGWLISRYMLGGERYDCHMISGQERKARGRGRIRSDHALCARISLCGQVADSV